MTQPPSPPMLEYARPASPVGVRRVGIAQRQIMKVLLCAIFATALMPGVGISFGFRLVALAALMLAFAVLALMMISVYRLAEAIGMNMASRILYVIGMVIPYVGIILLVVINQKATRLLRRNNIKVGLMGASLGDLPLD